MRKKCTHVGFDFRHTTSIYNADTANNQFYCFRFYKKPFYVYRFYKFPFLLPQT